MINKTSRNIRLAIMVIAGTACLIVAMYIVGDKQNLFGSTFEIKAHFKNVNGLMVGNNVRLAGIDVGTVSEIEMINDTAVLVVMAIDEESQQFIKKNATVSIGTDGLMGNKLINITPSGLPAGHVNEGDLLVAREPLEADAALRTLVTTNDDIANIAHNLSVFTENLNSSNSMWSVLTDSTSANNVKNAIDNFRVTSAYAAMITNDLAILISNVRSGKGAIGELLTDTIFVTSLNQTMTNIRNVSDSLVYFSADLNEISGTILEGDGAFQLIASDSAFSENLQQTLENIESASHGLDENMEALKHTFLFRGYYKKKARRIEKERRELD